MKESLRFKVEEIALKLQSISGLRNLYVVRRDPFSKQFMWLIVKEFHEDHIELGDGSLWPYGALVGYTFPPSEVIEQIRAKESGIDLHKKIITN